MPDDIYWILRRSILRKGSNRRAPFIEEENREEVRDFFSAHLGQILEEIFKRGDQVDLLAIYDKRARKLHIFRMDEVLTLLRNSEVSFSPKDIIRLGPFITVQRKGRRWEKGEGTEDGLEISEESAPVQVQPLGVLCTSTWHSSRERNLVSSFLMENSPTMLDIDDRYRYIISIPNLGMPTVVSLANQKGGVGKSTTAVNLAAILADDTS